MRLFVSCCIDTGNIEKHHDKTHFLLKEIHRPFIWDFSSIGGKIISEDHVPEIHQAMNTVFVYRHLDRLGNIGLINTDSIIY